MKNILVLAAFLALTPLLWADQPTPPLVPLPSDDNSLPPSLNQITPVTVPSLPGDDKTNAAPQEKIAPPPMAPTKAAVLTPTPSPVAETPTPAPETSAPEQASSLQAVSAGTLTDYFPVQQGAQWTYEYLRPASGQSAKGTYRVQCTDAKPMPNGTVRTVFETTENGQKSGDHYSLYGNQIEHMAEDGQTSTGDFVFKVPAKGGNAAWVVTEKDGTVHKSKAAFGQAEVYKKTYPDCVVVTEKVVKAGKTANTVIYYYAKGIGLVSIEVYSPKMKLVQDKSVALVSGPSDK